MTHAAHNLTISSIIIISLAIAPGTLVVGARTV
jgi:hypothetical protein